MKGLDEYDEEERADIEDVERNAPILEAHELLNIPEGLHKGEITAVSERTKPYHYIDVHLSVSDTKRDDGTPVILKAGFPAWLTQNSKLGKLLVRMGVNFKPKQMVELNQLIGKKVTFQTLNTESESGTFANVIPESVKPATKGE